MINLPYSLVIEATAEPDYFGFYSPDLTGFTGIGHSIENCVYQARYAMKEFVEEVQANNLPIPLPPNGQPLSFRMRS
jgi:predicted RNase H-like HicB family nuclease